MTSRADLTPRSCSELSSELPLDAIEGFNAGLLLSSCLPPSRSPWTSFACSGPMSPFATSQVLRQKASTRDRQPENRPEEVST
jgi:hypothetical protein